MGVGHAARQQDVAPGARHGARLLTVGHRPRERQVTLLQRGSHDTGRRHANGDTIAFVDAGR
jgi:hypothetical protein